MKKILLLVFFAMAGLAAYTQSFLDLNNQFMELYQKGQYKEALGIGSKAMIQAKKEYGEQHINYAIAVHNLAECHYALQAWKQALPLYHQAVKVYTIAQKTTATTEVALCNNNIGNIYLVQKKYDSSAIFFEQSFEFFITNIDEQYNNAIGVMNNLTSLYIPLKMYTAAVNVYNKILPTIETKEGITSENYNATNTNLISSLHGLSAYKKAVACLGMKRAGLVKTKGTASAELALCDNEIGNDYLILEQYDSASVYFEQSFSYFIAHANEQYENAIVLSNNLYALYTTTDKNKEICSVFEKIVPVIIAKEGKGNQNYITAITNWGTSLYLLNQYATAEKYMREIVAYYESNKKDNSTAYADVLCILAKSLRKQEKLDEAFLCYNKANKVYNTVYKTENNDNTAINLNNMGDILLSQDKFDSSATCFEKAFTYFLRKPNEKYETLVLIMHNLSDLYIPIGKYKEAKTVFEKMLPVIERVEGKEFKENYTYAIFNLGSALYYLQDYALSETYARKGLAGIEKIKGKNNTDYTDFLDMLANNLNEQSKFEETEQVLTQSLQIKKSLPKQDSLNLAISYGGFGNLYSSSGNYKKSFEYFDTAINLLTASGHEDDADYVVLLRNFGYAYIEGGRLLEAKKTLSKALAIQEKLYGKNYPVNGELLISISNAEVQLNELTDAEEHVQQGLDVVLAAYGENYYTAAKAKEVMAMINQKRGNNTRAITLYKEALAINTKIFGEESKHTASAFSNLGTVYEEIGNFAEAEPFLQKSADIRKKIYGDNHPDYAISLSNLALLYIYENKYKEADDILIKALNIYTKSGLEETNNFMSIINNIAFMAARQGLLDQAKKIYLQLLTILESKGDRRSSAYYLVLNNIAANCISQENYDDAITYGLKAVAYAKKYQGIKTLEYIKSTNNCLVAYKGKGDYEKAYQLAKELLPLCKEVMGNEAALTGTVYSNIALLENQRNNPEQAFDYLNKSLQISMDAFRKNFYTLSEKEKLNWWDGESASFAFFPSLLIEHPALAATATGYLTNIQMQLKNFILNDASATLRKARTSNNAALNKILDKWQLNRSIISKQLSMPVTERIYKTDSIEAVANELEKSINQQAAGLIKINQQNDITWQAVQSSLKEGEAAVEFISFPFYRQSKFTDTIQYAAIVIRKNEAPKFVPLATEKQVNWCLTGGKVNSKETRINSLYRSSIKSGSNETFAGDSLYNIIWKPLIPYLQNISTVSYSPDDLLHKVAFHALPMGKDKLLLDAYRLQQYTSIRQLTEKANETTKWNAAYLMGNADFNTLPVKASAETIATGSFTSNHNNEAWVPLPGTEKEINTLQPLLVSKGATVTATSGINATEEKFKLLNNHSPALIHLATHGFFLPNLQLKKSLGTVDNAANNYALSDDPLMRSGVIMAGANKAWSGQKIPSNTEDGIVTAYEIAQLNLTGTKLIVLSACETALGDLQGTEGVFGLQRAFKIAGVKNLIVSLWQVPDKETAELMGIFYSNLLSGLPVRDAFYKAQKEMRGKYPPYSWAAFVLIE